jgi:hypothetical protein
MRATLFHRAENVREVMGVVGKPGWLDYGVELAAENVGIGVIHQQLL